MRRIGAAMIALLLAVAIFPLVAAAQECRTASIEWQSDGSSPRLIDANETERNGVYWAIVGTYLQVYLGDSAPANWDTDPTSYELPAGASSATACDDGSVSFGAVYSLANNYCQEGKDYECQTTTSTVESTTSTTAGTTTTTVIDTTTTTSTESTTTTIPTTTTTDPTTTTSILSSTVTTTPATSSTLPFTGTMADSLGIFAAGCLLIGGVLLFTAGWERWQSRRKEAESEFRDQ